MSSRAQYKLYLSLTHKSLLIWWRERLQQSFCSCFED